MVEVCPLCDIAGCRHIRERELQSAALAELHKYPLSEAALARIAEAARKRFFEMAQQITAKVALDLAARDLDPEFNLDLGAKPAWTCASFKGLTTPSDETRKKIDRTDLITVQAELAALRRADEREADLVAKLRTARSDMLVEAEAALDQAGWISPDAANKATAFLVGDPKNGIPLRNPLAHEVAEAIRALLPEGEG